MTTIDTPATPAAEPQRAGASITTMATGLWVVVGSLLSYGIVMTVIKASALFTG